MIAKPIRPSRKKKATSIAAARLAGCTCRRPDVELVTWYSDTVQHERVLHEDGCPALGRRQVVVGP